MDLFKRINDYIQQGYKIGYYIVDQNENGYKTEVDLGGMPRYTYTIYVDFDDEMIWDYSVDSLEQGFELALNWLDNGKPKLPDLL